MEHPFRGYILRLAVLSFPHFRDSDEKFTREFKNVLLRRLVHTIRNPDGGIGKSAIVAAILYFCVFCVVNGELITTIVSKAG